MQQFTHSDCYQLMAYQTRKLCYRKGDRSMRTI